MVAFVALNQAPKTMSTVMIISYIDKKLRSDYIYEIFPTYT